MSLPEYIDPEAAVRCTHCGELVAQLHHAYGPFEIECLPCAQSLYEEAKKENKS